LKSSPPLGEPLRHWYALHGFADCACVLDVHYSVDGTASDGAWEAEGWTANARAAVDSTGRRTVVTTVADGSSPSARRPHSRGALTRQAALALGEKRAAPNRGQRPPHDGTVMRVGRSRVMINWMNRGLIIGQTRE
jgi:hypothetical protein